MKGNYLVIDTETGGVDKDKHQITQIAMIGVNAADMKEIARVETYIKPYMDLGLSKVALDKTGITRAQIDSGMEASEFVKTLFPDFCKVVRGGKKTRTNGVVIVGHNVSFDIAFLQKMFNGFGSDLSKEVSNNNGDILRIDTQQFARLHWMSDLTSSENKSITLTACCKRAEIELYDAHGAMQDTFATYQLLRYFTTLNNNVKLDVKEKKFRDTFQI